MNTHLNKLLSYFLLPALLAGFFGWMYVQKIPTDNLNTDEVIYVKRAVFYQKSLEGNFRDPIWQSWDSYDQPMLTNYIYGFNLQVRSKESIYELLNDIPVGNNQGPCQNSFTFYRDWECLQGTPLNRLPENLDKTRDLITYNRQLAVGLTIGIIITTYLVATLLAGYYTGIIASVILGYSTIMLEVGAMGMMDQILAIFLMIQLLLTLKIISSHRSNQINLIGYTLISGLALSTKFNAVVPTFITLAIIIWHQLKQKSFGLGLKTILINAFMILSIFTALNPYVWQNPLAKTVDMITYRLSEAQSQNHDNPQYAINNLDDAVIFFTNKTLLTERVDYPILPIVLLSLFAIGILALSSSNQNKSQAVFVYLVFNIAVTLLYIPLKWSRYLLPILPVTCITVAYGSHVVFDTIRNFVVKIVRTIRPVRKRVNLESLSAVGLFVLLGGLMLSPLLFLSTLDATLLMLSTILIIQGIISTYAMARTFIHQKNQVHLQLDQHVMAGKANHTFTLIVPAKQESNVIADTILAMDKINYPRSMVEILFIIPADDSATLQAANRALLQTSRGTVKIVTIDGDTHTKAYSLNLGLHFAKNEIIGVFDAEDEPHPELLHRIDATFTNQASTDAIQSAVQLTNLNSSWFSAINCLEYYFWFKSVLPFMAQFGATPLGGNTIFVKKSAIQKVGGWDENCLTEDIDLGIRLSAAGLTIKTSYEESLATLEESPRDELMFIKQRSRWDQGFLQTLLKKDWRQLQTRKQRFLIVYLLSQTIFRHIALVNMVVLPIVSLSIKANVVISLISFIPLYFLFAQIGLYCIGLSDLKKYYRLQFSPLLYIKTLAFFIPYQIMLLLSSLKAIGNLLIGRNIWEKTLHLNLHRKLVTSV